MKKTIQSLTSHIILFSALVLLAAGCTGPAPDDEGYFSDGGAYFGTGQGLQADTSASYAGDTPEVPY